MPHRRAFMKASAGVACAGVIAGCTGVDDQEETGDGVFSPLRTAFPSPVPGGYYAAMFPMLERVLEEHDSEIDREVFSGHTPIAAGFMQDEIDVGYISTDALIRAKAEELPIVTALEFTVGNMFTLVASPEIEDFEDLQGADVAAHSDASPTYAALRVMIEEELGDFDETVNNSFIFGSANRVSALQSGEIQATTAYTIDALQLEKDGEGTILGYPWDYDQLTEHTTMSWVVPTPTYDEREAQYVETFNVIAEALDRMYEDDLQDIIDGALEWEEYPDWDEDVWAETLEHYRDMELWPRYPSYEETLERTELAQERLIDVGLLGEESHAEVEPESIIDYRAFD